MQHLAPKNVDGARHIQTFMYLHAKPADNAYARPLDFVPVIDLNAGKVCRLCASIFKRRSMQVQRPITARQQSPQQQCPRKKHAPKHGSMSYTLRTDACTTRSYV